MRTFYSQLTLITILCVSAALSCSCSSDSIVTSRNQDFNLDWKFLIADPENAADPSFDDTNWNSVDLPHDWSIEDFEIQDSLHIGPFYKDQARGADIGYLRTGTCWYRKSWKTPSGVKNKEVILHFDGVQTQMELWINGEMAGHNVYGYSPLNFNISSFLKEAGKINTIAVKTINSGENSRWFSGAGIYRSVKLSIIDPLSVADWGVFITSPEVTASSATIHIEVKINNLGEEAKAGTCIATITGPDKELTVLKSEEFQIDAKGSGTIMLKGEIKDPVLWDLENPALYQASIEINSEEKTSDIYKNTFGIRSIDYSPEKGFLLNGKEVLMKGGCMHHDNGILGAAAFKDAEYRRVRIMKENGFNAIRTSHNPPSEYFLNACDEMGMLVIDEAFDHWMLAKRPKDYSSYFAEWHVRDLEAMIYRDRNHPSIVMWSVGNEIEERSHPEGIEIGKELIKTVKALDSSRPATQAVCAFWETPGKDWDYSEGAFSILDVHGYNYQLANYESDHKKYPERVIYGSESFSLEAWDNWELVKKHNYVIGDFVWTGMDYIGESGIGHTIISDLSKMDIYGLQPWPWYNAWCGDIDLIGNKKPQSYYRDIVWDESKLEIAVQHPVPEGKHEIPSKWGWPTEQANWNYSGQEGKVFTVRVYSSYPLVRLELNGKVVGEKELRKEDRYTAEFDVAFEAGTLKAYGIKNNEILESKELKTTEEIHAINLIAENQTFKADRSSLSFIRLEALNQDGNIVPDDGTNLTLSVSGEAELMAAGNAAPKIQGSMKDPIFNLFRGKGLIIIRSTGKAGKIKIHVTDGKLLSNEISLVAL